MGLQDQIASDAANVLLNTEDMSETITVYKKGDQNLSFTTTANVHRSAEEGSMQFHGDGPMRRGEEGERLRRTIMISVFDTVDISDTREPPDRIKLSTGEMFRVLRVTGRHARMLDFLCVRTDTLREKHPPVRS
jgi:hypothetical protein